MKIKLISTLLLSVSCFIASQISFATTTQASARCQSSCAGIPKGQCSCVTTDGIKCCGKKTDGLTSVPKPTN